MSACALEFLVMIRLEGFFSPLNDLLGDGMKNYSLEEQDKRDEGRISVLQCDLTSCASVADLVILRNANYEHKGNSLYDVD